MNKPWKVIQELEADNSRLKKEAIIKRENDADNVEFFEGVGMALDGFRTFGVKQVPKSTKDGGGLTWMEFNELVRQLEFREATGNTAKQMVQQACDELQTGQALAIGMIPGIRGQGLQCVAFGIGEQGLWECLRAPVDQQAENAVGFTQ